MTEYTEAPAPNSNSSNYERPLHSIDTKYTVVSMFSGCGGMDLGFKGGFTSHGKRYKKLPFDIVWANDLNETACATYEHNLGHSILPGDVWQHLNSLPDSTDVLIGGFPCQDISLNGKGAGVNGARSGLYKAMVEAIKKTRPKVFVAENVKGLLTKKHHASLKTVLSDFSALGYDVTFDLYQAADFGVPQSRERVFIVGTLPNQTSFIPPPPTITRENWVSAQAALQDLETAPRSEEFSHIWSEAKKSPEQGDRRLKADKPGQTIRAECHGNIQFHYKLPRRISMREAARIQSFPDDFIFKAKLRQTERQIGNAVPPVLAWNLAKSVLRTLS